MSDTEKKKAAEVHGPYLEHKLRDGLPLSKAERASLGALTEDELARAEYNKIKAAEEKALAKAEHEDMLQRPAEEVPYQKA